MSIAVLLSNILTYRKSKVIMRNIDFEFSLQVFILGFPEHIRVDFR